MPICQSFLIFLSLLLLGNEDTNTAAEGHRRERAGARSDEEEERGGGGHGGGGQGGNPIGFFGPKNCPRNWPKVTFEKNTTINFPFWTDFQAVFTTVVPFLIQ